ncbi:MAG: histone-like nucleoid-structuring protein Lsr2 [Nocardioides sp.]
MPDMPEDFIVARNPDGDSQLPFLLRIPLGDDGIILKSRESWPRKAKVYCHRVDEWPADVDVLERVPTRSCVRRGASIDLVLDRSRENRSQLVITRVRGGRQAIFWQTSRTAKQSRPGLSVPRQRASGQIGLEITVDTRERYAYDFADRQARVTRAALPVGDYGLVVDGRLEAVVERKSLADFVSSLTTGRLKFQLGELASVPRAAIVVEDRYAGVFKLRQVRPAIVADGLAECQVRWPNVPIFFADSRRLAQEWTFRFLGAAASALDEEEGGALAVAALAPAVAALVPAAPPPAVKPTNQEIRAWAREHGHTVSDRGRVPKAIVAAFTAATGRDVG